MPRDCWFGISLRLGIILKHLKRLVYSHWLQEQSGVAQLVKNLPAMLRPQFDSWIRKIHRRRDTSTSTGVDTTHSSILGFPSWLSWQRTTCNAGDLGLIPKLGRSPGEAKGYPLQYFGLENSNDCVVHGVTKRQDWESFTFTFIGGRKTQGCWNAPNKLVVFLMGGGGGQWKELKLNF